jgi:hypothetical protein
MGAHGSYLTSVCTPKHRWKLRFSYQPRGLGSIRSFSPHAATFCFLLTLSSSCSSRPSRARYPHTGASPDGPARPTSALADDPAHLTGAPTDGPTLPAGAPPAHVAPHRSSSVGSPPLDTGRSFSAQAPSTAISGHRAAPPSCSLIDSTELCHPPTPHTSPAVRAPSR